MRSSIIILSFFSLLVIVSLNSCSKDKTIERRLYTKDGTWNIDNINWTVVSQTDTGQVIQTGSTANAGTFTFNKDGNGTYSYAVDTFQRSGSFSYSVSDKNISITKISQSFSYTGSTSVQQTVFSFTGTETDKTKLTLTGSDTDQNISTSVNQFALTGTFYLTKK